MGTEHLSETEKRAHPLHDHRSEDFLCSPSYGGCTVAYRMLAPPHSEETESALLLEDCEYDSRMAMNDLAETYANSDAEGTPRISGVREHERNAVFSVLPIVGRRACAVVF